MISLTLRRSTIGLSLSLSLNSRFARIPRSDTQALPSMAVEVTEVLLSAQSSDGSVRKQAEDSLKQFQEQNYHAFLLSLAHELSNNEKPPESRRLAGLILKNSLDAKEAVRKAELVQAWVSLDATVKSQIKMALLITLLSSVADARHTAAQVIAKVAAIELPRREWPELVGSLLGNMGTSQTEKPSHLRQATLETLGYVCEELSPNILAPEQVNSILTAVVQGMMLSLKLLLMLWVTWQTHWVLMLRFCSRAPVSSMIFFRSVKHQKMIHSRRLHIGHSQQSSALSQDEFWGVPAEVSSLQECFNVSACCQDHCVHVL